MWRPVFTSFASGACLLLAASPALGELTSIDAPPPPARWYEWLEVSAFVDAYAGVNYNLPKPQLGSNALRSNDASNGFALSWVGIDIGHEPDPIGGSISLRFGPTAELLGDSCLSDDRDLNPCDGGLGLASVKTAAVAFRPTNSIELRLGKFDAPFGAETAESQDNFNYSRGLLYRHAYPVFHTGLSARFALLEELDLGVVLANGWNNSVDNNVGKSLGLSVTVHPVHELSVRAGWLAGPEQDDAVRIACGAGNSYSPSAGGCAPDPSGPPAAIYEVDRGGANEPEAYRQLLDLLIEVRASERLSILAGADYGFEGVKSLLTTDEEIDTQRYYGATLAARYELSPVWAVAVRGEYLGDPDGLATGDRDGELLSATLTVDALLEELLLLRLENRADFELADHEIFGSEVRDSSSRQITTTLSAVVVID